MQKITKLLTVLLVAATTFLTLANPTGRTAKAASGGGGGGNTFGFTFSYNVGAVTNYHAYALLHQIEPGWGCGDVQPPGSVIFGNWFCTDLGPISGYGTVTCTRPTCPTGKEQSDLGLLFLGSADDAGAGTVWTHPVIEAEIFLPHSYNGWASVEVINPGNIGVVLYWGPRFSPFGWDVSAYVY